MSMKCYGIKDCGLLLSVLEFQDLLKKNKNVVRYEELDKLEGEELAEAIEDIDINCLFDIAYDNDFNIYSEVEGEILSLDMKTREILDCDDVFILPLQKYNLHSILFEKYENEQEIYEELFNKLKDLGFKNIDLDYIKQKTGWIDGTYFG